MILSPLHKRLTLTAALILVGCSDAQKAETITPPTESDVEISVTSDLATPGGVTAVTFVPNSAAAWLGAIVLLTEDGRLHRTDGQSSKPVRISEGPYTDIFGLARQAQPGVFLALEADGSVDAFIEVDDAGNFGPIPLSLNDKTISRFCANSSPQDESLWAITESSTATKLNVTVQDNKAVELTESQGVSLPKGSKGKACAAGPDDQLSVLTDKGVFNLETGEWQEASYPASTEDLVALPGTGNLLSTQASSPHILLTDEVSTQAIALKDGLSIRGLDNVSYVTVTDANLGTTFSEGVIIAVDADSNRLVMVARDYVLSELNLFE